MLVQNALNWSALQQLTPASRGKYLQSLPTYSSALKKLGQGNYQ
jgi:hypothetical protein